MTNLYVTSGETFAGKSALCLGLGERFRADGLHVGYMKPVNVGCQVQDGLPYDDDVAFAREAFAMPEPLNTLLPVALTPARLLGQLQGPEEDYEPRLRTAYAQVAEGRDVVVLEGGRNWREGHVAGLPARRVVRLLHAQAVVVLRYADTFVADRALAAQEYFGDPLYGVVINETPVEHMERVQETLVPYLARHGLRVLGVLPREPLLAATTVAELAEGLHAELLDGAANHGGELIQHMMVGAMNIEAALSHFRRLANKVVVTGGDRADIQMAALETPTRCLVLTGNLYPSPRVLSRADELGVPVLLTEMDTLGAVEVIESQLGRSRFQQPQKVALFTTLLNKYFDFGLLYAGLGLQPRPVPR